MNNQSGIYKITNILNNKIYIGSAKCFNKRWCKHKSLLNNNKHGNEYLQNSWNKYGNDKFKFDIIEIVLNIENLISREQYYLDLYKCYDNKIGYNIAKIAGTTIGININVGINNAMYGTGNKVIQLSKDNKYIKTWISAHDAAKFLNGNRSHIKSCCIGKRKTAYKFKWKYDFS